MLLLYRPHGGPFVSVDLFALATLATRADKAMGPPPTKFYALRDNLVAIVLTDNTILAPNLILLGTFLVPICTVLFILSRPRSTHLSVHAIVLGFLAGGTAGVMVTGTIEIYVLPDAFATNTLIGIIEEGGKALILVAVAAVVRTRVPRDGMVLGATIGAGFAAFESAGTRSGS
jgi:RsiW-degrading membrane proteinase PrsW (M82 family)